MTFLQSSPSLLLKLPNLQKKNNNNNSKETDKKKSKNLKKKKNTGQGKSHLPNTERKQPVTAVVFMNQTQRGFFLCHVTV